MIPLHRALVIILKRGAVEAQLALAPEGSRMVVLDPLLGRLFSTGCGPETLCTGSGFQLRLCNRVI